MSDISLLVVLTSLILLSGVFLTFSWHKYLVTLKKKKTAKTGH
jgi:uncharacterized protein (DUF486 family)